MYPLVAVALKVHVSPQLLVTTVTFTDVPGASVPLAGVAVIPGPVNCADQFKPALELLGLLKVTWHVAAEVPVVQLRGGWRHPGSPPRADSPPIAGA
jgi:hypothetical protein